jgi:hypothetical protein
MYTVAISKIVRNCQVYMCQSASVGPGLVEDSGCEFLSLAVLKRIPEISARYHLHL